MRVTYDVPLTLVSLLPPGLTSAFSLFIVSRSTLPWPRLLGAGWLIGAGIVSMHCIGMAAMKTEPTVPLAADESGPASVQPVEHDAGIDWQDAGRTAPRRGRGRREIAERRIDSIQPRPITVLDRPRLEARSCECYATRWSRPSSTICFQHQQRATLWPRGRMLKRSTSNLQQRAVPRTPRLSNTANSCAHGFQGFFTAHYAASLGTTNNTVGNG